MRRAAIFSIAVLAGLILSSGLNVEAKSDPLVKHRVHTDDFTCSVDGGPGECTNNGQIASGYIKSCFFDGDYAEQWAIMKGEVVFSFLEPVPAKHTHYVTGHLQYRIFNNGIIERAPVVSYRQAAYEWKSGSLIVSSGISCRSVYGGGTVRGDSKRLVLDGKLS